MAKKTAKIDVSALLAARLGLLSKASDTEIKKEVGRLLRDGQLEQLRSGLEDSEVGYSLETAIILAGLFDSKCVKSALLLLEGRRNAIPKIIQVYRMAGQGSLPKMTKRLSSNAARMLLVLGEGDPSSVVMFAVSRFEDIGHKDRKIWRNMAAKLYEKRPDAFSEKDFNKLALAFLFPNRMLDREIVRLGSGALQPMLQIAKTTVDVDHKERLFELMGAIAKKAPHSKEAQALRSYLSEAFDTDYPAWKKAGPLLETLGIDPVSLLMRFVKRGEAKNEHFIGLAEFVERNPAQERAEAALWVLLRQLKDSKDMNDRGQGEAFTKAVGAFVKAQPASEEKLLNELQRLSWTQDGSTWLIGAKAISSLSERTTDSLFNVVFFDRETARGRLFALAYVSAKRGFPTNAQWVGEFLEVAFYGYDPSLVRKDETYRKTFYGHEYVAYKETFISPIVVAGMGPQLIPSIIKFYHGQSDDIGMRNQCLSTLEQIARLNEGDPRLLKMFPFLFELLRNLQAVLNQYEISAKDIFVAIGRQAVVPLLDEYVRHPAKQETIAWILNEISAAIGEPVTGVVAESGKPPDLQELFSRYALDVNVSAAAKVGPVAQEKKPAKVKVK